MQSIRYQINGDLDLDKVIELYNLSTLGERRPIHHREIMRNVITSYSIHYTKLYEPEIGGYESDHEVPFVVRKPCEYVNANPTVALIIEMETTLSK